MVREIRYTDIQVSTGIYRYNTDTRYMGWVRVTYLYTYLVGEHLVTIVTNPS